MTERPIQRTARCCSRRDRKRDMRVVASEQGRARRAELVLRTASSQTDRPLGRRSLCKDSHATRLREIAETLTPPAPPSRARPLSETGGLLAAIATALLLANLAHRRVVDPSVDRTIGRKTRFPSAACTSKGVPSRRIHGPAFVQRDVSWLKSDRPRMSPPARLATWSTCSSSRSTSPKPCNFAGAGAGKPPIGLVARPASRSSEGRQRRRTPPGASLGFARSATEPPAVTRTQDGTVA